MSKRIDIGKELYGFESVKKKRKSAAEVAPWQAGKRHLNFSHKYREN